MFGKIVLSLLSVAATIALALDGRDGRVQAADPGGPLADTDGDFLPDCVEWAVLTSATNPDTDGDLTGDFVEVVQRVAPRAHGQRIQTDQELRIVVTGPQPGSGETTAWMHLLVRIVGPLSSMTSFQTWLELPWLPGVQLPFDMLSLGPSVFRDRSAGSEGTWLSISVPLASIQMLRSLAPMSLHVRSVISGRVLESAVKLLNAQGELATLVPFDDTGYALHSLEPLPATSGGGGESNRVCVLELAEVGSGPGGTVYEVVDADCEDCNEVECSTTCAQSVGWILTLPGGLGVLGAN